MSLNISIVSGLCVFWAPKLSGVPVALDRHSPLPKGKFVLSRPFALLALDRNAHEYTMQDIYRTGIRITENIKVSCLQSVLEYSFW